MLTLTLAALFGDTPVVVLAAVSVADARILHGQRVVPGFTSAAPSFTWNGRTVAGAGPAAELERTAVLTGERVVDVGEKVSVVGTLFVINHAPALVGGVFVPGWTEVRVAGD
jgi:hypothetical protein